MGPSRSVSWGAEQELLEGNVPPLEIDLIELEDDRGNGYRLGNRDLDVSVLIPTLNEAQNLPSVLAGIPQWVSEVVIIDGRSTDRTVAIARECLPKARVLTQQGKGKGDALCQGFEACRGDVVVTLDADGSMAPEEIVRFVAALHQGADIAKGSRFIGDGGSEDLTWFRRTGNHVLKWLTNRLFGTSFSDLCYGFNALRKEALATLRPDCDGFEIEALLITRAAGIGLKIVEVPSYEKARMHGTSNLKAVPDGFRVLRTIVFEWWGISRRSTSRIGAIS